MVRSFLEEELNYLLFRRVTGISANRILRDKLKDIIDRSAGEIQTFQLARAKKHLKMKDGKLSVEIGMSDKAEWVFNWGAAILVTLFSLGLFMLSGTVKGITLPQLVTLMGLGILFFFFALFLMSQTLPLSVARRLKPIIERLESDSENDG